MPTDKIERLYARISSETSDQLTELAARWGGIHPISRTEAVVEAIRRAWEAERAERNNRCESASRKP
jgi:hypothetical protein